MALYWMNEKSGKMKRAVESLFSNEQNLSADDMCNLKNYIRTWLNDDKFRLSDKNRQSLNEKLNNLDNKLELMNFCYELNDKHLIDPF